MNKLFFYLLIILCLFDLSTQVDPCTGFVNPQSYSQCQAFDNITANTICCWVRGVYGGNNGTACLPSDILFQNRSVSFTLSGQTGTMICGYTIISSSFINLSKYMLFMVFILLAF